MIVTDREVWQSIAPLDHLEHRAVVIHAGRDLPAHAERRNHQTGNAEAEAAVFVAGGCGGRRDGRRGWRYVVEEAAPFVEIDYQDGAGPSRSARDCPVDGAQERFATANVGVGMVVVGRALRSPRKRGSTNETAGRVPAKASA